MKNEHRVEAATEIAETPAGERHTATALSGFFLGLALVLVVPFAFAATLALAFDQHTVEELFPLVLLLLVVPLALIAVGRTRLFGRYMLIGIVLTAAVVLGVGAAVIWVMVQSQG